MTNETNSQMLRRIFHDNDPMIAIMALQALEQYADSILEQSEEEFVAEYENSKGMIVHPLTWHRCAQQIKGAISKHLDS